MKINPISFKGIYAVGSSTSNSNMASDRLDKVVDFINSSDKTIRSFNSNVPLFQEVNSDSPAVGVCYEYNPSGIDGYIFTGDDASKVNKINKEFNDKIDELQAKPNKSSANYFESFRLAIQKREFALKQVLYTRTASEKGVYVSWEKQDEPTFWTVR